MEGVGIAPLSKRSLAKMSKGMPVRIIKGSTNLMVSPHRISGISKAFAKNKGHQLALSPEEIEINGEGIFGKAFDKGLKKLGIKKAVYKAGDKVKPIVKQVIDKGAKALEVAVPQLKPAISPLAGLTKDYLDRPGYYQKKKGRNALNALKRIGVKAGTQIARDQAINYLLPTEGQGLYAGSGMGHMSAGMGHMSAGMGHMSAGYGMYASSRGSGMYAGSRGYGMVTGKTNVANNMLIPALRSQPFGENFMWGSTLPVEYAKIHR